MIIANSIQQYNKWKSWLRGDIKNREMFILTQTYGNEICGLCNKLDINRDTLTDDQIFKMVAERIIPPNCL
jgi:hypothetical protein